MPDRIVELDGVQHHFPADATDAEIASALSGGDTHTMGSGDQPSSNSALSLAAGSGAVPLAANAAERFFTSPTLPKTAATVGRVIGAVAPIAGGASYGGVGGAVVGASEAARGSWVGGRTGWFTGKMLQSMSEPVAKGLRAAAPYAEAAGKVAGPQGALDLAQMAEPNRKDIGFFGVGPSVDVPGAEPPWLNAVLGRLYGRLTAK